MKKINNFTTKLPFYILIFFTAIFLQSCELFGDDNDDAPKLPEATQTGENTFAFKVNGKVINVTNTSKQTAIYQNEFIQFGAGGVYIIIENPLEINKNYLLKGKSSYYVDPNPELGCHYEFEDSYEGHVVFTKIDRTNYIVSGTFEFSTKTDNCDDIRITQGVFDMRYIP
ncbi:hypothetical protein [Polaribacter vadi]|uniref:hypothetical protein n=1 Tax=Polaribacter vadi TaxID=1774273 RepID=UPI0030EE5811|tara:strand:+ start:3410 stop:3919 length:510 start_codon:yes stop_codon:yes gene_type:complete